MCEQAEILLNTLSAPLLAKDGVDALFDRQTLIARDVELKQAIRSLEAIEA